MDNAAHRKEGAILIDSQFNDDTNCDKRQRENIENIENKNNIPPNSLLGESGDVDMLAETFRSLNKKNIDEKEKIAKNHGDNVIFYQPMELDKTYNEILALESKVKGLNSLVADIVSDASEYSFGTLSKPIITTMMQIEDQLASITSPYRFTIMSSKNDFEHEVHQMVMRANDGLPPEKPYHPSEWKNVFEFVRDTYGKYLKSCGAQDDCLFLDNLRAIHPDGAKLSKLRTRIRNEKSFAKRKSLEAQLDSLTKQMGSSAWGNDVAMALYNYFRNRKDQKLTDFIKRKSDRGEKEREVLRSDPKVLPVDPKAPSAYLKKQYLLK